MSSQVSKRWNIPPWLPWASIAISFFSGYCFSTTESESTKALAAGGLGFFLGITLCLWGLEEYRDERIRGVRTYVKRSESPILFATLLAFKRFIPGAIMVVAGMWHALVTDSFT